jgi:hypothetical protein
MRVNRVVGMAAIILIQSLTFSAIAQTANPSARVLVPSSTAGGAVIQSQLSARSQAAGRTGGAEADAIYKRYVTGIGRPIATGAGMGSSSTEAASRSGGY